MRPGWSSMASSRNTSLGLRDEPTAVVCRYSTYRALSWGIHEFMNSATERQVVVPAALTGHRLP